MGVVTDKSLQGLTTAVQGISTTGMSDTTGQAINSTLGTLMTNTTGQDINTTLQAILGAISPQLVTEEHNLGSMNIAQGSRGVFLKDVTKAGYTILGIVQIRLSNNWHCLSSFILSGSSAQVVMQNINSNSLDQTVYATILYMKN